MPQIGVSAKLVVATFSVVLLMFAQTAVTQSSGLPPAPIDTSGDLKSEPRYLINKITIRGNTVLSRSEILALVGRYERTRLGLSQLEQFRLELSKLYYAKGYINTGAIFPEQDITDGEVVFIVVEGELSKVAIRGAESVRESVVRRVIARQVDSPVNINDLQDALQYLKRRYPISSINAKLNPLSSIGKAELDLNVNESTSQEFRFSLNNYRSPSVGGEQLALSYVNESLIGYGDPLYISLSASEGVENDTFFSYSLPVTRFDTEVNLSYSKANSFVVEEPFNSLDVESSAQYQKIGVTQPFSLGVNNLVKISLGYQENHSESYLLGEPFSFSSGAVDGEAHAAVSVIGFEFVHRGKEFVLASRLGFKQGLDQSGVTINEGEIPDGKFSALTGQFHYVQRLLMLPGHSIQVKYTFQETSDPLLAIEKFGVGGRYTVRGYRENTYVRDTGSIINIEYHMPLAILSESRNAELVIFYDYGQSSDLGYAISETSTTIPSRSDSISSLGLGANWKPKPWINIDVTWANAFTEIEFPEEDVLQDNGFHFAIDFVLPLN